MSCVTCFMLEKVTATIVPQSGVMCHLFGVRCDMTGVCVMCLVSPITRHGSSAICQMSSVMCHQSIVRKRTDGATYCLFVRFNVSLDRCHVSHVKCQVWTVSCQMSDVTYQVSDVRCHVSPLSCQKRKRQEPAPLPSRLLHPQHLSGIWSCLMLYRLPFVTNSEHPEPWLGFFLGLGKKQNPQKVRVLFFSQHFPSMSGTQFVFQR